MLACGFRARRRTPSAVISPAFLAPSGLMAAEVGIQGERYPDQLEVRTNRYGSEETNLINISPASEPTLARWANEPFAYLTTIGRRTGAPHRIEIWFAVDQGTLYLLSGGRDRADWVRNLQANPNLSVQLGTETLAGIAQVLQPDDPGDHRARELLVNKYRQGNDLDEWGRTSLPVMITFASLTETSRQAATNQEEQRT